MSIKKGIALTNEEFFFLASLFKCNALIGVPDPFIGYWLEEIETEMKRAAKSLVHKGYIVYKNNDIDIMPELLEYVKICTKTNMTLWIQSEQEGQEEESYFYLNARKVIESRVSENDDQLSYLLQERGNPAQTWREIVQAMLPEEKPIVYEGIITLPLDTFTDLLEERHYYNLQQIEKTLKAKGVPAKVAKVLAHSIKEYKYRGRISSFYHMENEFRINSLYVLCTEQTNWVARRVERQFEELVEIRSVSLSQFLQEMDDVITRAKKPAARMM
ncbi:hypothetical protein MUG87_14410 [Ectobacillus sp. JY-23]|uniref:hypothetical protein n=1 Tax=Ectobacillus sp. JY-23 TaxID=2933872 RepID=UPI001FF48F83|nr:hypothetical protein [Ectobacillus sp. JY-23]UOY91675.1 hypothetical protein MUG87_14410 [Ectobacillus sp. JY-23]